MATLAVVRLVPILLSVAACAIGATALAQGVPQDGFPSWQERTVWVLVNRDRADPQTALASCIDGGGCPDSSCYPAPLPPMAYDVSLGHSARLQPTLLAENNVTLMHPSPCLLKSDIAQTYPDECDGGTDCVCQTAVQCSNPPDTNFTECGCSEDTSDTSKFEDPFTRIRMFTPGASAYAENLAAGQPDPMSVEAGWLTEPCTCCAAFACVSLDCPDGTVNGHRANILSTAVNSIGTGAVATPAGDCWGGAGTYYWGQDFAFFYNVGVQKLVAGSHFPQSGITTCGPDGGDCSVAITFYANWFDPVGGAPSKAAVVIGAQSHAMTLDRGDADAGNATYAYVATLPSKSCQPYTFAFTDSSGLALTLPVSGNYLAGDDCKADYGSGGCASGSGGSGGTGEPWLGGLLLAAVVLRRRRKAGDAPIHDRKLTKWQ